jgi:hypothetical protein
MGFNLNRDEGKKSTGKETFQTINASNMSRMPVKSLKRFYITGMTEYWFIFMKKQF